MTIYRRRRGGERAAQAERAGLAADGGPDRIAVADVSYQSDALAQIIVNAWVKREYKERLLDKTDRAFARTELAKRGIYVDNPVIIEEDEYWDDYTQDDDNEVVFVLPNKRRVATDAPQHSLLETAKLLMACVPNGI